MDELVSASSVKYMPVKHIWFGFIKPEIVHRIQDVFMPEEWRRSFKHKRTYEGFTFNITCMGE